jgi:ribosomal protein S18 acetylase RimI-like enzyme
MRVLGYPVYPAPATWLARSCAYLGWDLLDVGQMKLPYVPGKWEPFGSFPVDADVIVFRYWKALKHHDSFISNAAAGKKVINYDCLDVRKSTVASAFEEAFGYALSVDPYSYTGGMVLKSEKNGAHDGRILQGPIDRFETRRATLADLPACMRLAAEVHAETYRKQGMKDQQISQILNPDPNDAGRDFSLPWWRGYIERPDSILLVATTAGGEIVGYVKARIDAKNPKKAVDRGTYVYSAYQRRNIGALLRDAIDSELSARGVVKVEVTFLKTNQASVQFVQTIRKMKFLKENKLKTPPWTGLTAVKYEYIVDPHESVYQRYVNNVLEPGKSILDFRVPYFKGIGIPLVNARVYAEVDRFKQEGPAAHLDSYIQETTDAFSRDEIERLCKMFDLLSVDYGEADVLRDVDSGSLYVVDVNDTSHILNIVPILERRGEWARTLKVMSDSFAALVDIGGYSK